MGFELDTVDLELFYFCVSELDSVAEFSGNGSPKQVSPPEQPVHPSTSPLACGGTDHKSCGWVLSFCAVNKGANCL